jgi:predicted lipoprotein with Yx(FWY)xxD motif
MLQDWQSMQCLLIVLVENRSTEETMQHPRIAIAGIGVAVLAAAGGITAATVSTSTATAAPAARHSVAATSVRTARVLVGGKMETVLTTATGLPLYYYQPDTATKSLVTGGLAQAWPPLTSAAPTGTGLSGQLSVLKDVNGQQVTYNGHPLYTFVDDHAGLATGQGVQDFFVATPGLAPIASGPAASNSMAPAGPSGGYNYSY